MTLQQRLLGTVSQKVQEVLDLAKRPQRLYEPVKTEESFDDGDRSRDASLVGRFYRTCQNGSRRFWLSVAALAVIALSLEVSLSSSHSPAISARIVQHQLLFLLVPSAQPDNEVCKTITSANILGYPTPYLANWDPELDHPERHSERHYEQIKLTKDYLFGMRKRHADDVVIVLEGPHAWFQLRPEVLMSRYYAINDEANRRLRNSFGGNATAVEGIEQSVVMSAQSYCSEHSLEEVACSAVPAPPREISIDPGMRYPNVGTIVGPVKSLKKIFEAALNKANDLKASGAAVGSQAIFEELFGEQEFRRGLVKQRYVAQTKKMWQIFGMGHDDTPPGSTANVKNDAFEFGIGLDYRNELGLSVGRHEMNDVTLTKHNSSSTALPRDIADSEPPFWTSTGQDLPTARSWRDVRLYQNRKTKSIPAVMTFKSNSGSPLLSVQVSGWKNLWMQQHVRPLFEAVQRVPKLPIASVVDYGNSTGGVEHVFWNPEVRLERDRAKTVGGAWVAWKDMCTWEPLE